MQVMSKNFRESLQGEYNMRQKAVDITILQGMGKI
jgi:hypothetical protein